jgi:hypothetical protein
MGALSFKMSGNALPIAYEILKKKGWRINLRKEGGTLIAHKGEVQISAEDTVQLLGLVAIFEERGGKWQASDRAIEEYLEKTE